MRITYINGDIAQLGERCVRNAKAAGSNPVVSTHRSLVSAMEGSRGAFSFAGIAKFSIGLYNKIVSSSGRSAALGLYRRCPVSH